MDTVYVLGAGFTKAFLPDAPLTVDDYDAKSLLKKYAPFSYATKILKHEVDRKPSGLIDVERLMTRLDSLMPYDKPLGREIELKLLLADIKTAFITRIQNAKGREFHDAELKAFARHCIESEINCVTFNYDDVFDEALWDKATGVVRPYWHPDGGYGFFCKPSSDCIQAYEGYKDHPQMHLLKLHGSMNWRPRLGWPQPYGVDSIVHHSDWFLEDQFLFDEGGPQSEDIAPHLEPDPFIVPPVLVKAALTQEPLLQTVWSLAYKALTQASKVVFLGYSMPRTDIAAHTLFSETLNSETEIEVVNLSKTNVARAEIRASYRRVLSSIPDAAFVWGDAKAWCATVVESSNPMPAQHSLLN